MESIQVKDVSYQYTRRNENDEVIETLSALSDVSFSIEQGSFVCILGHNGSGKSTLAKLFNALQLPGEGTVLVSGMDSREEKNIFPIRREVGWSFKIPIIRLLPLWWKRTSDSVRRTSVFRPTRYGRG